MNNIDKEKNEDIIKTFFKEWEDICSLSYEEILKEYDKNKITVLETKKQEWDGYNPKITDGIQYFITANEYKFIEDDIKNKLRNILISIIDKDAFRPKSMRYEMSKVKLFSPVEYNNIIIKDIAELKDAINSSEKIKEERFEYEIFDGEKTDIYNSSKSVNMLKIPLANPEDIVVRIYDCNSFYSYEFLIVGKEKVNFVALYTSD